MRVITARLVGYPTVPYSPSHQHFIPKKDREGDDAYDERTWRDHANVDEKGEVVIPSFALKQAIDMAAQKLGMKVPGRGSTRYKGLFTSGLIVDNDLKLMNGTGEPFTKDMATIIILSCNPAGERGGGKRVLRRFPLFFDWHAEARLLIVDEALSPSVVEQHLVMAGRVVGLGRFRPENGGSNGRFTVTNFKEEESA